MPNLEQLVKLHEAYGPSENITNNKAFQIQNLTEGFKLDGPSCSSDFLSYFNRRRKSDVALLFIDITSFSEKFDNKNENYLARYLDRYYEKVIPIIYHYGGEIEKIIGDGIIAVFGEPFLDDNIECLIRRAYNCSRKIIKKLFNSSMKVKIAIHNGSIMYYQNKNSEYSEFTMIGRALTDLFRLESISINNSDNFFMPTVCNNTILYKNGYLLGRRVKLLKSFSNGWVKSLDERALLRGTDYNKYCYLEYIGADSYCE